MGEMNTQNRRLIRHLIAIVALKLALLTGIWWAFIRDARVEVGVDEASDHLFPTLQQKDSKP